MDTPSALYRPSSAYHMPGIGLRYPFFAVAAYRWKGTSESLTGVSKASSNGDRLTYCRSYVGDFPFPVVDSFISAEGLVRENHDCITRASE